MTPKTYQINAVKVSLVVDAKIAAESKKVSDPAAVAAICRAYVGDVDREYLIAILLNTRNKVIAINTVSIGTLTASLVHPREVFKPTILAGAAGIVIAHNHPSGETSPSPEDRECTRRLKSAGELLGIPLLDHVIVGTAAGEYKSLKESGVI